MSVAKVVTAALLAALAGCAGAAPVRSVMIHREFRALRPAMVALRVDGPEEGAAALSEALYRGLIAKDYSVLAPGAPAGSETGFFRARLLAAEAELGAEASFEDPFGTVVYRCRVAELRGDAAELAAELLRELPSKR